MTTSRMENYVENIYMLIENKGYARAIDLSEILKVSPTSATKMLQRLAEQGFGIYEKYRGFTLTVKGKELAENIIKKHKALEDFLRIIGVQEKTIYQEVEGMEHHISLQTANQISSFVQVLRNNPEMLDMIQKERMGKDGLT